MKTIDRGDLWKNKDIEGFKEWPDAKTDELDV